MGEDDAVAAMLTLRCRDGRHWNSNFASLLADGDVWIAQQRLLAGAIGRMGAKETRISRAATQACVQAHAACARSEFDSELISS
jgi:hypothetical protein